MRGWKHLIRLSLSLGGLFCSIVLLTPVLSIAQLPPPSQSTNVTISNPQNGATVNKIVNVTGSWSGSVNVYKVDLLCDSQVVQSQNINPPTPSGSFSFYWDSRSTSNGSHTLTVKAYTPYPPGGQASVGVQVSNTLPQIIITQPQANATVQGYVGVSGSWTGDYLVWKVELLCNGNSVTSQNVDPPAESGNFSFTWDSTSVPNGSHTLTVKTYIQGQYGGAVQNSVPVNVSNPQPQVTILFPSEGAILNSIAHITARATWIKELSQVMLWIDGCGYQWQSVSSSDVTVTFDIDTTAFRDGNHSLKVIASGGPQWTWGMAEISVNFKNMLGSFPFYAMMGPTNLSSGNYHLSATDISIPGRGLGLLFQRSYNSLDPSEGPLGVGWRHNYQMQILDHPQGGKLFIDSEGGRIKFTDNGDGTYSPPPGIHLWLTQNPDGTWEVSKKDGTKFVFSPTGVLIFIIDSNDNQISLAYNGALLAAVTDPSGRQLLFSYTEGRLTSIQDPAGRVFTFDYDMTGNLKKVTYPDGGSLTYTYDSSHHITSITDQIGRTTYISYDAMGRVAQITSPLNNTTSYYYYPSFTQIIDPLGNTYTTYYDSAGRPVKETDPLGYYTLKSWDNNSNLVAITDKAGATTSMQYDEYGNLTEITDPLGYTTHLTYEYTYHKPTAITDALGRTTNFAYDSRGNLTSSTLPSGRQTTYTYNNYGLMTSMTDPAGHTTSFQYDVYGNMITMSDSLGNTESYTYNILGWKLSETDAIGRTKCYTYDSMGRLTNISYPNGSSVSFAYNLAGERISIGDWRGQTYFIYDGEGKLLKKIEPDGKYIEYSYDQAGRLTTTRSQAGKITFYGYNARGDIVWMKDEGGRQASFLYDAVGRLTRATYPNGIYTQYSYNANGWLTSVATLRASGGTIASFSYSYNPIGKKTGCLDHKGREVSWVYDVDGQLVSELWKKVSTGEILFQQSFTYDQAGNRTSMLNSIWGNISYQYDGANRLIQAGDISYTWDANGNQLQKITPQGNWGYLYDFENRLVQVAHPVGGITQFAYAGAGYERVWMKRKNGDEIYFFYDGDKMTAEFNSQGSLLRAYRYGPQVLWMEEGGNIFFLHTDGQGSVRAVTNIQGQIVAEYSYDAFGNQLEGEEGWNPFKYCGIFGYIKDEEIALMKVGARFYDPEIGRWIQKDPILSGVNWWVYCENDPVNYVDPKGLIPCPYCGKDIPDAPGQYESHHCYWPSPVYQPPPPQSGPWYYHPPGGYGYNSPPPFWESFKEFINSVIEFMRSLIDWFKSLFVPRFAFGGGKGGGHGATGEW